MWQSKGLEDDARQAELRGMTFKVVSKPAQGKRWETVGPPVHDLSKAVALAKEIDAWESGVFTAGPGKLAGYLYWSSHHPDLFNSSVIYLWNHQEPAKRNLAPQRLSSIDPPDHEH